MGFESMPREKTCPKCHGKGTIANNEKCPRYKGTGQIPA